jgi:hypothetical protein
MFFELPVQIKNFYFFLGIWLMVLQLPLNIL